MLADIGSPDKFVKTNELKEVTTGNLFTRMESVPDDVGLVSYEIFGNPGTPQRKMTFGYVDLGDIFVHPMAFNALISLKKAIKSVIYGEDLFYVLNGSLIKVDEASEVPKGVDVGNGCHWLRNHLREIDFKKGKPKISQGVLDKIRFISQLEDDEIFISNWLIIPAYYRDVDMSSSKKNEINIMYQSLITQSISVKAMVNMFSGTHEVSDAHRKIQDKLIEIYDYFIEFIGGTKSFFQKHGLGKAIDYSARMVISTAHITSNNPDMMSVDYSHSSVPLSMVLECFEPFIEYGFKNWVKSQINGSEYIFSKNPDGSLKRIPLASHWEQCMLHENIHDLIKLYTDSKEHRLDYFTVEAEDGSQIPLGYITDDGNVASSSDDTEFTTKKTIRPITLCELFYMIAMDTCKNKQVMITRFPIEDYQSVYPSLMNIIPYEKTKVAAINGTTYERFPDISLSDIGRKHESDVGENFNDTLQMFPTYLKALGADFDGDTVTCQGIFSENNTQEYIDSPMNFVNISGSTMRAITDVITEIVFAMTRTASDY